MMERDKVAPVPCAPTQEEMAAFIATRVRRDRRRGSWHRGRAPRVHGPIAYSMDMAHRGIFEPRNGGVYSDPDGRSEPIKRKG